MMVWAFSQYFEARFWRVFFVGVSSLKLCNQKFQIQILRFFSKKENPTSSPLHTASTPSLSPRCGERELQRERQREREKKRERERESKRWRETERDRDPNCNSHVISLIQRGVLQGYLTYKKTHPPRTLP